MSRWLTPASEGEFDGLVHLGLGQVLAAKAGGAEGDDGAVVV